MKNTPKFGRRHETSKLLQDGEARRKEMGVRVGEFRRALDQIQCRGLSKWRSPVGGWI